MFFPAAKLYIAANEGSRNSYCSFRLSGHKQAVLILMRFEQQIVSFFLQITETKLSTNMHGFYVLHTHTRLMTICPGLHGWAGTRKVKPIWILLKQETVSGTGISWAVCKSAPRSRQITTPAPHHSLFLQAGCPSCRPTNSVKVLKAIEY